MQEDAADIYVTRKFPEQAGDAAVHDDAGGGNDHHESGLDGHGGDETMQRRESDPRGENGERERVDEGGENAGALVAEGLVVGGGTRLQPHGDKAERERKEV